MQLIFSVYAETHADGYVEGGVTYVAADSIEAAIEIVKEYLEDEAIISGFMYGRDYWHTASQNISFIPVPLSEFLRENKFEEILNQDDVEEE